MHPHGVIHSEATWFVRGIPKVKQAFTQLWGTDDLICSFDGICAFRPWNIEPSWRSTGPWFHTDQPAFAPDDSCAHRASASPPPPPAPALLLFCQIQVRVEIMGSQKCRITGKYQSALIMINPITFTRPRTHGRLLNVFDRRVRLLAQTMARWVSSESTYKVSST
eukprot:COSAG01_NODE_5591_length_4159_cov_59.059852_6_plen_165_part_00